MSTKRRPQMYRFVTLTAADAQNIDTKNQSRFAGPETRRTHLVEHLAVNKSCLSEDNSKTTFIMSLLKTIRK